MTAPRPPIVPASDALLDDLDAYWRAANFLSVGQIYLYDNPLLLEPLRPEHIKPRLLGHFGTTPGLNFVYAHLNRLIVEHDLDMIYVAGPGHGGPGMVANAYLEGTYSEVYPRISEDEAGLRSLFTQFSFPGGIPSHHAPQIPGSIHEGGELGYSLSHAFGAAFDNPSLVVACVIGDGEAETGPLATSWHSNKFLDPEKDGAVLPILHLNGYKIAGPTVLARIDRAELESLLRGLGWAPHFVAGHDPKRMHRAMADTLDAVLVEIRAIQVDARTHGFTRRPTWPMIVLDSPKGWTGPAFVDGKAVEGTFRSHQVPLPNARTDPEQLAQLQAWMLSYGPRALFDDRGRLHHRLAALHPRGPRRMSANPHANGGMLLRDLDLPAFREYAVDIARPGSVVVESTRIQGRYLRDVLRRNEAAANFRLFSPDETVSNRWTAVFEATSRTSTATILPTDDHVAPTGRVMEMLSEHQCEGWLEGYLLTGRHGLHVSYEGFIRIIDSMVSQHAKWLKVTRELPWRRPIASLDIMLSSHVWEQDHNGFTHQDPGFLDHVVDKAPDVVRVYLPPDANCLLSVTDHCLRSRDYVNVIVAGKAPSLVWLDVAAAAEHCAAGLGVWQWASNDADGVDVVMACCGDVPTRETLAAVAILRERFADLRIRVVNVVDLMRLRSSREHPHGLDDAAFDRIFSVDKPIIFAFHGYPTLIHRLTYRRTNHANLHVRGYKEEGTTTTPFDMTVLNDLDRFRLAADVVRRVPRLEAHAGAARRWFESKRAEHTAYIRVHGEDMPEIRNWRWPAHTTTNRSH